MFAFAGALVLNRSFARELPNDCLDALIAAPISGAALFLGKALANFVLVLAVELVSLPVFGIFYNVRWTSQFGELMLVLALGTWALTVIGTIFSALTVNIRLREVMLPMLTYPILVPALIGRHAVDHGAGGRQADRAGHGGVAENADRVRRGLHGGLAGSGGDGAGGMMVVYA